MKILHIAIREDDDETAMSLLTRLCETASEGQTPISEPDAYVYRAWVEPVDFIPSGGDGQRDARA